jgi:hypothetical protein
MPLAPPHRAIVVGRQPLQFGPLRFLAVSHGAGIAQTKPFAYRFALAPQRSKSPSRRTGAPWSRQERYARVPVRTTDWSLIVMVRVPEMTAYAYTFAKRDGAWKIEAQAWGRTS